MKMQIGKLIKQIGSFVTKNSPTILTGLGIVGLVSTTLLAMDAVPKATRILEDDYTERYTKNGKKGKLSKLDEVKITWKCYIPTIISGGLTIVCMVGSNSVNAKRTAVLSSLYSVSELALTEYKNKVVEVVGQNKAAQIKDEIAKDTLEKKTKINTQVIVTGKGTTKCFDCLSGREFETDIEKLKQLEFEINKRLLVDEFISVNDLYYELGLDDIYLGNDEGWTIDDPLEFEFSSQLDKNNMPCLVINCKVVPRHK